MKSVWVYAATAALVALLSTPLWAQERPSPAFATAAAARSAAPVPNRAVAAPLPQDYVIGADDVLQVHFWREQDLSTEVVVRPDGRISLPLLRDVSAMGLTPDELGGRIQALAATYLENPNVTVSVKQINSRRVFITGEVAKPGTYAMGSPITVLQLIALAGGLTPYAKQDRIVIMRTTKEGTQTFRFDYKKASQLKDLQSNILLMPGDTVLIP